MKRFGKRELYMPIKQLETIETSEINEASQPTLNGDETSHSSPWNENAENIVQTSRIVQSVPKPTAKPRQVEAESCMNRPLCSHFQSLRKWSSKDGFPTKQYRIATMIEAATSGLLSLTRYV